MSRKLLRHTIVVCTFAWAASTIADADAPSVVSWIDWNLSSYGSYTCSQTSPQHEAIPSGWFQRYTTNGHYACPNSGPAGDYATNNSEYVRPDGECGRFDTCDSPGNTSSHPLTCAPYFGTQTQTVTNGDHDLRIEANDYTAQDEQAGLCGAALLEVQSCHLGAQRVVHILTAAKYNNTDCPGGDNNLCPSTDPSDIYACNAQESRWWDYSNCECMVSPIIIDVDGDGLSLSSAANGVLFDLAAVGSPQRMAWTAEGARDAFLVLDRNGNGKIDDGSELFGSVTSQPAATSATNFKANGFLALKVFDSKANGGNQDGLISKDDKVWSSLRLWFDVNHDGISQTNELQTLDRHGLSEISLHYMDSDQRDEFGNLLKLQASVRASADKDARRRLVLRSAIDVYLRSIK